MRIGIDLMGSDSSPQELFQAVLMAQEQLPAIDALVVFATSECISSLSHRVPHRSQGVKAAAIEFVEASETISMESSPLLAVRRQKHSSMVLGVGQLASKKIDAFVSAGNTGALIASARIKMETLPGIDRPALLALLPTQKGVVAVIDVGGNVDCKAAHLIQFARMGVAFHSALHHFKSLRIGLLNIGTESKKGNAEVRQAYHSLEKHYAEGPVKFVGNVEGREVFEGKVDVLVTDGFTGNVFLKTSEGISRYILEMLQEEMGHQVPRVNSAFQRLQETINSDEYPGAVLCGVDGVMIKCHGYLSAKGMFNGIRGAMHLVEHRLIEKLGVELGIV